MQSKAATVTAYLEEVPEERRAALARLRQLCLDTLVGYDEGMAYGMPSYARNSVVEVAFASQRNYISLYVMKKEAVETQREALAAAKIKVGKGCINFPKPERIPFDIVQALLVATVQSSGEPC
jgi:uncharacterized protein YdhG (YjbR/CyaY superfamily)